MLVSLQMCVLPTFKVKTGIKAKAAVPPNKSALIEKYLHSEEWLYSRGVPTLCRGSRFVPDGQPVKLEHPPWPPVFDCCLVNDLDLVSRYLEAGADVNMRNPRVKSLSYANSSHYVSPHRLTLCDCDRRAAASCTKQQSTA